LKYYGGLKVSEVHLRNHKTLKSKL